MTTKNIYLEDGTSDNPISRQLRSYDLDVGDCQFDGRHPIFKVFGEQAARYYTAETRQWCDDGNGPSDMSCGLCDHPVTSYFTAKLSSKTPLVTYHPYLCDGGAHIHWPDRIDMGSKCIKNIGVPTYNYAMYSSYFNDGDDRECRMKVDVAKNKIMIGSLLKYADKWRRSYVRIPHSYFTMIPEDVMREMRINLVLLENAFPQGKNKYFNALHKQKKYDICTYHLLDVIDDISNMHERTCNSLATVINREEAKRTFEVYKELRNGK